MVTDDAELMFRFAAGAPGSAAEMYRAYGRLVYTVAYRLLGEAGLAQDATGQTFAQAWQLAASLDPGHPVGPWLATLADRVAADIDRRTRRTRHGAGAEQTEPGPVIPAHSTENTYDVWLVRRALDTLSDQDRELIRLRHDGQLTPKEISDRLAIPLASVKSRSYQAHRRFAGLLGQLRSGREAATPPVGSSPRQSLDREGARS